MNIKYSMGKYINRYLISFKKWVSLHHFQLAAFNIVLIILLLLRSAGYFEPVFLISINVIVFFGLVLAILILDARSNFILVITTIFLLWALVLFLLNLRVWAERTSIYFFEAFILAIIMLIIEKLFLREKNTE